MKRIIYTLIAAAVVLTGCETGPHADFSASDYVVEVGEEVSFYNNSINSYDFEWDFNDGFIAYIENPVHSFSEPGFYNVRLAAFDGDEVDYAYVNIEVLEPVTILEIKVLEYYNHYPVEDASIIIYPTYEDFLNETNVIAEVYTNKNGIAIVEGLNPSNYYLDIWHESHDNYSLADEDISYIKVSGMRYGEINYFTAWVDYVDRLKSATTKRVRHKSNNIEKRIFDPKR